MSVFENIKDVTGTPYHRSIHNKDILDRLVLRRARQKGLRLPTGMSPDEWVFFGAFVFTPTAGINRNVTYLDLSSLYPNIMRAINIGPDTIVGTEDELRDSEWTKDDCVWSYIDTREVKHLDSDEQWRDFTDGEYKIVYDPNQQTVKWRDDPQFTRCYYLHPDIKEGFLKELVEELIELKYQYEGGLYEAIKRITNSIFGFCSYLTESNSSRIADWRFGESITLAGRKVIQHTADVGIEVMGEHFDGVFVSHGDTDGVGLAVPSAPTRDTALDAAWDVADYLNDDGYSQFMYETFGVDEDAHYMEVEVESFAPSVFVPRDFSVDNESDGVKKRYAQWITVEDGAETDSIDIKGFEAKRSDVAPITREMQTQLFEWLLKRDFGDAWADIAPYCRDKHDAVQSGSVSVSEVAKRGGIGQSLDEYGSTSRRPSPIYRGAKYADRFIEGESLSEGSKPMCVYVDYIEPASSLPATYEADTAEDGLAVDAIAVEDSSNLPSGVVIDWERHCTKAVKEPLEPILKTVGKDWQSVLYQHEQSGFDNFL
jgi:DNA polymerase I